MANNNLLNFLIGIIVSVLFIILSSCNSDEPTKPEEELKKSLTLLTPNGGEIYTSGDTLKIEWEYENLEFVNIFYSISEQKEWILIEDSVDGNANEYLWIIPDLNTLNGKIQLIESTNILNTDISNNYFVVQIDTTVILDSIRMEHLSYYPLQIGNIWIYSFEEWNYWDNGRTTILDTISVQIIGDTVLEGKKYYVFLENDSKEIYDRIDSTSIALYTYINEEIERFQFSSKAGYRNDYSGYLTILESIYQKYLKKTLDVKSFEYRANSWINRYSFGKKWD